MPTSAQTKHKLTVDSSLHRNALGKVSRLVDRTAALESGIIRQKLHRDDLEHGHEKVGRIGHGYIAALGRNGYRPAVPCLNLIDVRYRLAFQLVNTAQCNGQAVLIY